MAYQKMSRTYSFILADALILEELRRIHGLEMVQVMHCDIEAGSLHPLDPSCSPNLLVLGIDEYSKDTVGRYFYIHGLIGIPDQPSQVFTFSAGCDLVSVTKGQRTWQPFHLTLTVYQKHQDNIERVFFYLPGTWDRVPRPKNAENPCPEICRLLATYPPVSPELAD